MAAFHRVGSTQDLLSNDNRLHVQVEGRYVTLLKTGNKLHAFDSICYHAGGPLALGDIEELAVGAEGRCLTTIRCPWHYFQVSLDTGEKYYQPLERNAEQKLVPGPWTSVGVKQRIHVVEERPDGLYVALQLDGEAASDEKAFDEKCGRRLVLGTSSTHVAGFAYPQTPEAAREDVHYLRNKSAHLLNSAGNECMYVVYREVTLSQPPGMDAARRMGNCTTSIGEGDDLIPALLEETAPP